MKEKRQAVKRARTVAKKRAEQPERTDAKVHQNGQAVGSDRNGPAEPPVLTKATKADLESVRNISQEEARMLIGLYESTQKTRIQCGNKKSAHERGADMVAPAELAFLRQKQEQFLFLEKDTVRALETFAKSEPLGRWALSIMGIGPVVAAGLLAHIDLKRCCCPQYRHLVGPERDAIPKHDCIGVPTAGHLWSYAGLNPNQVWSKGQKRPFNRGLKVLCWKAAKSFVKLSTRKDLSADSFLYVRLYLQRKKQEVERNEKGMFSDQATQRLDKAKKGGWGISAEQRDTWQGGKLQAAGLELRAMRYAIKLFLSHYHEVGFRLLGLPLPVPYAMAKSQHAHYIPPPCWPMGE